MNDETIKQSAEAAKEMSIAAQKGIDLTNKFGSFIGKFVAAPLEEASGHITDKIKYLRWENRLALMVKAEKRLQELNINTFRQIPLKIALPLIENASLEDDDSLQQLWANLLVNYSNGDSGIDLSFAYIDLLKNISPLEVKILKEIYLIKDTDSIHKSIKTKNLPTSAEYVTGLEKLTEEVFEIQPNIQLALDNLHRLDLISLSMTWGGGRSYTSLNQTYLGSRFVNACSAL